MTLVAFACYADRIEAITDTASYTRTVTQLGQVTKHVALPHLDALVITQGHHGFGVGAKVAILEASGEFATFDELAQEVPTMLPGIWAQNDSAINLGTVFLLGYSPAEEAFVAWQYAAEHDFHQERVSQPFVTPAPFSVAPPAIERERAGAYLEPEQHHLLANWDRRAALEAPDSTQGWLDLALTVRHERALEPFMRVIVAGRVFHTVLRRGRVATRQIHEFADHGEEFLQLIAWTQHPQAQLMECHCGSGARFVDCHLAPYLDEECDCDSGRAFRECCMVDRVDATAAAAALAG